MHPTPREYRQLLSHSNRLVCLKEWLSIVLIPCHGELQPENIELGGDFTVGCPESSAEFDVDRHRGSYDLLSALRGEHFRSDSLFVKLPRQRRMATNPM